jgi:hypothetical protein
MRGFTPLKKAYFIYLPTIIEYKLSISQYRSRRLSRVKIISFDIQNRGQLACEKIPLQSRGCDVPFF